MKTITTGAALAGAAALTVSVLAAAPASAARASGDPLHSGHDHGAVFAQTDDVDANSVIAYHRKADGTLAQTGVYATGGMGDVLTGSVVDHLASQGSVAYDRDRQLLYVVNAGSDDITVFAVRGDALVRRQIVPSGGDFPVSITTHGNLVYVLNARDGGSVQGYLRLGDRLVKIPSWHRNLGLDTAATPEFTHTPGQVAFSPDGSKVLVTTKAGGQSIDVFDVNWFGGLSATPVVNDLPGAVPFAITFDRQGHVVAAEAGPNAVATFGLTRHGRLAPITSAATGQAATCWIVGTGSLFYASNAGSGTLSGYRDLGAGNLTALGTTSTDAGTVDAAASADGHYLYVQAGGSGAIDEFRVDVDGSLSPLGSVLIPGGIGAEGIAAS